MAHGQKLGELEQQPSVEGGERLSHHLSLTSLGRGKEGGTRGLASAPSWMQASLVCHAQALPAAMWTHVPWKEHCSESAF